MTSFSPPNIVGADLERRIALARLGSMLDCLRWRDSTVYAAYSWGMTKAEISRRSGLARTTIDRILLVQSARIKEEGE